MIVKLVSFEMKGKIRYMLVWEKDGDRVASAPHSFRTAEKAIRWAVKRNLKFA